MLLAATAQMRYASMEEAAVAIVIAKDASQASSHTDDKKAYVDTTRVEEQGEEGSVEGKENSSAVGGPP